MGSTRAVVHAILARLAGCATRPTAHTPSPALFGTPLEQLLTPQLSQSATHLQMEMVSPQLLVAARAITGNHRQPHATNVLWATHARFLVPKFRKLRSYVLQALPHWLAKIHAQAALQAHIVLDRVYTRARPEPTPSATHQRALLALPATIALQRVKCPCSAKPASTQLAVK